jgi:hypothetical protein
MTISPVGLQLDSTGSLPFTPRLQALYINGEFAVHPVYGRGRVYIDVLGTRPDGAMWLDVESGDATPEDVPVWLDKRARFGFSGPDAGIYCNRDTLPAVELAAGRRPHLLWVATLDGTLDITPPPGVGVLALVQVYPAAMLGINADISVVTDQQYWDARHG